MKQSILIFKNSLLGVLCRVVTIIFTFIIRNFFIKYVGIELLGINSTFASVLETLSLSELGFQSAIIFSLYKPLHDKDLENINAFMNILRIVYHVVGIIFIALSILMLPFLHFILSEIEITPQIYIYYILQAGTSTCTYFYAYKRALLYADQKDYVSKICDMICNIFFGILQCILLVTLKSYTLYLIIKIVQVYISNHILNKFCRKMYPYLQVRKIDVEKLKKVTKDVRNIIASNIAGYVYKSTDNIIISAFISTVSVGYLSNYTVVTKSMRALLVSALNPVIPAIGNYLIEDDSNAGREEMFLLYSHIRYLIAFFTIIPIVLLIDNFICIWIGKNMILEQSLTILISVDLYIDFVHSSTCDFITSAGLFKEEKYVEVVGAIINIATSLLLVRVIGIQGVLLGTVVSQIVFWLGRSVILYRKCLKESWLHFFEYWIRNILYFIFFTICCLIGKMIIGLIEGNGGICHFITKAIVLEICLGVISVPMLAWVPEHRKLLKLLLKIKAGNKKNL